MELRHKDLKISIITVSIVLLKTMNTMKNIMKTIKIDQIKLIELKNILFELKNSLEGLTHINTLQKKRMMNLKQ